MFLLSVNVQASTIQSDINAHDISIHDISSFVVPLEDVKVTFIEKILPDVSSMPSLRFFRKYRVDEGFLPLMGCIPNQKTGQLLTLRYGSFNIRLIAGDWSNEAREL